MLQTNTLDLRSVNPIALATFAAVLVSLHFGRRQAEHDRDGNAVVRPPGVIASLLISGYFAWEAFSKLDDPFYVKYPENLYVLLGFVTFGMLSALLLHRMHTTLVSGRIIEHVPLFWHKEFELSSLSEINDNGSFTSLRFAGGKKIKLAHMFSGVPGFIVAVRSNAPRVIVTNEV